MSCIRYDYDQEINEHPHHQTQAIKVKFDNKEFSTINYKIEDLYQDPNPIKRRPSKVLILSLDEREFELFSKYQENMQVLQFLKQLAEKDLKGKNKKKSKNDIAYTIGSFSKINEAKRFPEPTNVIFGLFKNFRANNTDVKVINVVRNVWHGDRWMSNDRIVYDIIGLIHPD